MRTCEPFNLKHRGIVYTAEVEQRDDIGWVYRWRGPQDAAFTTFAQFLRLWPDSTCAEAVADATRKIRHILDTVDVHAKSDAIAG